MGFDDNGLPTERFVEKKYNIDKSKTTRSEFIKLCLEETEKGIQTYKNLWNSLGISVDWNKTYSTIAPLATKVSQKSIIDLYKKGALYKKELPILWCPFCQTAISQSDLEDKTYASKMNYINFCTLEGQKLLIATTRPELIPACVALYVNPTDDRFKDLIGQKAIVPLLEHQVEIKGSEKVEKETAATPTIYQYGAKVAIGSYFYTSIITRYGYDCAGCNIGLDGAAGTSSGIRVKNVSVRQANGSYLDGLTYEGYYIVAADKAFPFCTVLEIENKNMRGYGLVPGEPFKAIVLDRGGAIKTTHLDLYAGSERNLSIIAGGKNSGIKVTVVDFLKWSTNSLGQKVCK
jgi:3D (Asp-Asp-Asp) domain-containing protein